MNRYAFPLCIQLAMPETPAQPGFLQTLSLLQKLGFYGVELNLTDFAFFSPAALRRLLDDYGLKMTLIATGAYARQRGLSLSSPDETVRGDTVRALRDHVIPYAAQMGAGLICGFLKGPGGENGAVAAGRLRKSLAELDGCLRQARVDLYLEATNHYEATVVNRLEEGAFPEFPRVLTLPDTYHMNIEERSMAGALCAQAGRYRNVHLSDNNRYFPGFGALDFLQILALLKGIGYDGTVCIEGRVRGDLQSDIERSAAYLADVSMRLEA